MPNQITACWSVSLQSILLKICIPISVLVFSMASVAKLPVRVPRYANSPAILG